MISHHSPDNWITLAIAGGFITNVGFRAHEALQFQVPSGYLYNIAMDNGPFIDDLPSYKPPFIVDFPRLC